MVASIYTEILQYEETGGDMAERLREMNTLHIFEMMLDNYKEDLSKFNRALFYILHTYTLGSKFHIIGDDWQEIKERIATRVGIHNVATNVPEQDFYRDVVMLKSQPVVSSVHKYIDHQGNRKFKHLCMLKDLYVEMIGSANSNILKSSGETDYDQKYKNQGYAESLYTKIGEWEQIIAQDNSSLKEAVKELDELKKNNQLSLRMEENLYHA